MSSKSKLRAIRELWTVTGSPDTAAVLDRFPSLRADKSMLLDLILEEYIQRTDAGETVSIKGFAERFPEYCHSILNLLEMHQFATRNESSICDSISFRWPQIGDRLFDAYQIIRLLGSGGFAKVYLARQEATNRLVVLKVSPPNPLEPLVLGKLDHRNVVYIHDARTINGVSVIVMPFVGSSTLLDLLDIAFRDGKVAHPAPDSLYKAIVRDYQPEDQTQIIQAPRAKRNYYLQIQRLMTHLAEGLAHIHAHGIIHRDLKPTNVLLTWEGEPVIVDFNLAVDSSRPFDHLGGTLRYMAPEQIQAALSRERSTNVDARADVFAFGVIAYELLTGHHPFLLSQTIGDERNKRIVHEKSANESRKNQSNLLGPKKGVKASDSRHNNARSPSDQTSSQADSANQRDRLDSDKEWMRLGSSNVQSDKPINHLRSENPAAPSPLELAHLLLMRQRQQCMPPRMYSPRIDRGLERLVMRCLRYDPGDRPGSAVDMIAELRRLNEPGRRIWRWVDSAFSLMFRPIAGIALLLRAVQAALRKSTGAQLVSGQGPVDGDCDIVVYISPMAYMRSISTILWTSLRHPFSWTAIDLTTGRVVMRSENQFQAEDVEDEFTD